MLRRRVPLSADTSCGWWPILGGILALLTLGASYWHVDAPYPNENERFGVGLAGSADEILDYDLEALGAGWYLNWWVAADPPHPNGVPFMQTIRLDEGVPRVSDERVTELVRANPGATWQIGNEPDSIYMDNCTPQQYARAYHEFYHLIKDEDPTAQVAFGGLVQATPLRMLYLEHVWQTYQDLYNESMPVDVWPLHSYILNEQDCDVNPHNCWGAEIPPGMEAYRHLATVYEIRDHDDMDIFRQRIERFRQWMADHGQRDKPLIVNEYGILMWPDIVDEDGEDFGSDRVISFMEATFDYFRTATDPALGYPADDNRLVQAWAWYSLGDDVYRDGEQVGEGYNGDLFTGPYTNTMTAVGQAYSDYVHDQVGIGPLYTDLWPIGLQTDVEGRDLVWGEETTITLMAEVANYGRRPAEDVEVQFWDGEPGANGTLIGEEVIPEVPGRYEGTGIANMAWMTTMSDTHTVWAEVDPDGDVAESDEGNNERSFQLDLGGDLVAGSLWFKPPVPLLEGARITATASVLITNVSQLKAPEGAEVWFWMKQPGQEELEEPVDRSTLDSLAAGERTAVTATLSITTGGLHRVTAQVDPADTLAEIDEGNNRVVEPLLVATTQVWLPTVVRNK